MDYEYNIRMDFEKLRGIAMLEHSVNLQKIDIQRIIYNMNKSTLPRLKDLLTLNLAIETARLQLLEYDLNSAREDYNLKIGSV